MENDYCLPIKELPRMAAYRYAGENNSLLFSVSRRDN